MYRQSRLFFHTPSIRFTYALAKSCGSAVALTSSAEGASATAAATTTSAVDSAAKTIFESFDELPTHLRPHVFEEAEIEAIHMGGAASYVPKHLQRKKK
ncbi:hypothetical protein GH5_03330 [Leishmania sp. Ghana 2012 LV757]|uniref:hypothetical protein n=1 Tax=Leishmania sp. Ghana 2012 LV757 TaxID=2803181 RepID=UPI001B52BBC2|nr:hypothetical protein GH5_03330 [Leishmania sp. Ghana 2012 LV757]